MTVDNINHAHSDSMIHIDNFVDKASATPSEEPHFNGAAIVDDSGREVLITEAMVSKALADLHQENIDYSSSYCLAACTSLS